MRLLRLALQLDAAVTALNGAAYLLAAPLLEELLGLPTGPLRGVGAFLLCYAVAVWAVTIRPTTSPSAVRTVIAVNLVWTVDSLVVGALGWGTPTTAGTGWIVLQALFVGGFAALQHAGLGERSRS